MLFKKSLLGAAAVLLLSTGAAMAVHTATVDGITIPLDSTLGGAVFTVQTDSESLLTGVGSILQGVGTVNSIKDVPSSTVTYGQPCYTVGCAGVFLTDEFTGFTVRAVTPVFDSGGTQTGNTVLLTGGQLNYYVHTTLPNLNTGSQATDIANAISGTLFLGLVPAPIDAAGDTFSIFVPGTDLGNFTDIAQGQGYLNVLPGVLGGDAGHYFDTNTFSTTTPTFTGAPADIKFVGNANLDQGADFPVTGSDDTFANTVPEPASLALLGAGLFLMAWSLRRKSSSSRSI